MTRREFTSAKRELEQLEHTDAGEYDEPLEVKIGGDPDEPPDDADLSLVIVDGEVVEGDPNP